MNLLVQAIVAGVQLLGKGAIVRLPLAEKIGQPILSGPCEQGPGPSLTFRPGPENLNRRVQNEDFPTVFGEPTVLGIEKGPAAKGDDPFARGLGHGLQTRRLARTEGRFTMTLENLPDRTSGLVLDLLIQIGKGPIQRFGKGPTQRGFSRSGRTIQEEVRHGQNTCGRPVR
jgi:hypothetical protein